MDEQFSYEGLYRLLEERRAKRPEGSYTTYLFEKGLDKILKKVGEECTEVIIAAKDRDHKETVYELADLAYHVLVLMVEAGRAGRPPRHRPQGEAGEDGLRPGGVRRICTQSEGAPGAAKRLQGLRFICTGPTARRPRRWPPPR